jgi:tRNA nucleotidyltransferase (CCA-adding enzyme)
LLGSRVAQPEPIIERLMLPREEAKALTQGGQVARRIPDLRAAERPSQVAALLDRMSHAALVAGMALTAEGDAEGGMATHAKIAAYAREWRYVQPALNGDDLKRMGLPPGKLFGTLLRQLRLARLDGLVATAQDEQVFVRRALESRTQQNSAAQSSADQHNAAADSEPP